MHVDKVVYICLPYPLNGYLPLLPQGVPGTVARYRQACRGWVKCPQRLRAAAVQAAPRRLRRECRRTSRRTTVSRGEPPS